MSKKFKKIMAVLLCAALAVGTIGCGNKEKKVKDVPVTEISEKVQEAYGDNYVASYRFTDEEFQAMFGVDPKDCEEYAAYGSMISVHVDKFIAIKAKADKKADIKSALETYQNSLKEDFLQYPINIPKIQASQIKEYGDYIFFIMLGFAEDEEADEETLLKQFEEQDAIAIKVIEDLLYGVQ